MIQKGSMSTYNGCRVSSPINDLPPQCRISNTDQHYGLYTEFHHQHDLRHQNRHHQDYVLSLGNTGTVRMKCSQLLKIKSPGCSLGPFLDGILAFSIERIASQPETRDPEDLSARGPLYSLSNFSVIKNDLSSPYPVQ